MRLKVVETARRAPGKCALTGSSSGPFLDTGKELPRYGRIYFSLHMLKPLLRDVGFYYEEEVAELNERLAQAEKEVERLTEVENDHTQLVDAVKGYIEVEPEVHVEVRREVRKPTDEEVEAWIEQFGADHPAVQRAKKPVKGSTEQWFRLYGNKGKQFAAPTEESEEEPENENSESEEDEGRFVELHEQKVDLDKILAENVKTVVEFAEGKDPEFEKALVRREFILSEGNPRKGVLQALGYWDEDGPIHPNELGDDEEE